MLKNILIILISSFLLLTCSNKDEIELSSQLSEEEKVAAVYAEAVEALNRGDAFYAAKKI